MVTSTIIKKINQFIRHHNLIKPKATLILGLSGGPDSVFLLHVLKELQKQGLINQIIASHLNHEWRPNAHEDEQFCQNLAQHYEVVYESCTFSKLNLHCKFNGSQEEIGRHARRIFFEQLLHKYRADAIALGHHRQDQQETFFIRLLRGSSLTGLVGMRPVQGNYIRPLLQTNKQEILDFLHQYSITYLIDQTNSSPIYLRNRIRTQIVPNFEQCDSRFEQSFERTMLNLHETEQFLEQLTEEMFKVCAELQGNIYYLNKKKLLALHPSMLKRLIIYWLCKEKVKFPISSAFFNEIIKFLISEQGGTHQLTNHWRLHKKQNKIWLQRDSRT